MRASQRAGLLLVTALLWLLAQYKRGMADAASLLHRPPDAGVS